MRTPALMLLVGAVLVVAGVVSHDHHQARMVELARDVPYPAARDGQPAYPRNAAYADAMRAGEGGTARAVCLWLGAGLVVLGVVAGPLGRWWDEIPPGSRAAAH